MFDQLTARQILDALPERAAWITPDGTVGAANLAWTTHHRLELGLGDRFENYWEDRRIVAGGLRIKADFNRVANGFSQHTVTEFVRESGEAKAWYRIDFVRMNTPSGGVLARETTMSVTRESDARLRDLELRYRSIFENSTSGIFQTTPDGHYLRVNPALARLYGYESEEELIATVSDIKSQLYVEPRRREEFKMIMAEHGRVTDFVSEIVRRDGTRIWIRENAHAVRSDAGEILYYEGWVEDVTEKRRAEAELHRAKAAAEAASVAKSEFLATMSHELRTPLNGIIGMAEILVESNLNDEDRDCARTVHSSAELLLGLVNDILDFSKIEAGKLMVESARVNLEDVVDDTLRMIAARAGDKGLRLTVDWGDGVPLAIMSDALRIRQCLGNLLGNAVKFTEKGGVFLRVRFGGNEGPLARVRFEIEDTGIGIDTEAGERLFQPFSQGDSSTTRKFGGTGLGLVIVRSLARMMGGDVGFRSHPGIGSVFHFDILASPVGAIAEKAAGPNVLVVEANAKSRASFVSCLRRAGANVQGAFASAEEASGKGVLADMVLTTDADVSSLNLPILRVGPIGAPSQAGQIANPLRMGELRRAFEQARVSSRVTSSRNTSPEVLIASASQIESRILSLQLNKLGFAARALSDSSAVSKALHQPQAPWLLIDSSFSPDVADLISERRRRERDGLAPRLKIIGLAEPNSNEHERLRAAGADACLAKPVQPQRFRTLLQSERLI